MRTIMVMFDTLCRRFLPSYGGNEVIAPNFARLAQRTVQFQNCYVGSMPCMPARHELHSGRHNFLHRSWGPLEGFDASMPEILARAGVHTHLATDHYHYWEDGGATYHNRYSTCEFIRGQEGDAWHGWAGPVPDHQRCTHRGGAKARCSFNDTTTQDWVNRTVMTSEAAMPQARTFGNGLDFVRRNAAFDGWFCQIETFDPHEPFFTQQAWRDLYPHAWDDGVFDWPSYERVTQDGRHIEHVRCMYKALLSMCDHHLGRVLDLMDEQDMWKDTMLIVNTDHGFLLGEHDWWGKCRMPWYQEAAHIPLWIWDPRSGRHGCTRDSLVQTIDLAPTLLEFFGQPIPDTMQGRPLRQLIDNDTPIRQGAIFGIHGGHVNWTDGRHVYMRGPAGERNAPLYDYTTMPTHMRSRYSLDELRSWHQHPGFVHTQGCPVMAFPRAGKSWMNELGSRIFDVVADYDQQHPLRDAGLETRLVRELVGAMAAADAPAEQYERLGLPTPDRVADPDALRASLHCG
jgi:arylsulfatase A-like enzyme